MDLHIKVSSILQTFPSYREPGVREVALSNILEREKHGSFPLQSQGASRKGHSRNKTLLCHLKETAVSAASLGRGPRTPVHIPFPYTHISGLRARDSALGQCTPTSQLSPPHAVNGLASTVACLAISDS